MIDVAIRFDDPSAVSDHALERNLLDLLAKHGLPATFAVIPCASGQPVCANSVPHLVEAARMGTVEIAQHGFDHESRSPRGTPPSEFTGIALAEQTSRIAAGRAILREVFGTPVVGFVPPFNTFDEGTCVALATQGFQYLSAGAEHGPAARTNLALVPRTCQITSLRAAINEARRRPGRSVAIIAVIHHYDMKEYGNPMAALSMQDLSALLAWLREQGDVRLNTLADLSRRYDVRTWSRAVRRYRWVRRRHWRIQALFPNHCLMLQPIFFYPRAKRTPT